MFIRSASTGSFNSTHSRYPTLLAYTYEASDVLRLKQRPSRSPPSRQDHVIAYTLDENIEH